MTRRQKSACKLFAADARKSLERYDNISISAYNYGLSPSGAVLAELRAMLPNVTVDGDGFMGFVSFRKERP